MKNNIQEKSFQFAIRIVNLCKLLRTERKEYTLSNQLLRSGTSIGANVREAIRGYSKSDFTAKMGIALKEASESEFWIEILRDSQYITEQQAVSMLTDCVELIKLLMSIIKTSQKSL